MLGALGARGGFGGEGASLGGVKAAANFPGFAAALAKVRAGTANATLAIVGESHAMGYGSNGAGYTNARVNAWPLKLAALFSGAGTTAITSSTFQDQNVVAGGSTVPAYDPRVTVGAGWVFTSGAYSTGGAIANNNASTNAYSFAPGTTTDTCVIDYIGGFGSFTVDIGGSVLATVNTGLVTSLQPASVTVTATRGTNTWNIKPTTTTSNDFLLGIDCYDSTVKSLRVWDLAAAGLTISYFADSGFAFRPAPYLQFKAPTLTLIEVITNDEIAGTSDSDFQTFYQTVITAARVGGGEVGIVVSPATAISLIAQATQDHYRALLATIAAANNVPILSLPAIEGTYENNTSDYFDTIHHANAGQVKDAANVFTFVGH